MTLSFNQWQCMASQMPLSEEATVEGMNSEYGKCVACQIMVRMQDDKLFRHYYKDKLCAGSRCHPLGYWSDDW